MPTYAVLGAAGGTGKACVETLLKLQDGSKVRGGSAHYKAVVRDPEKAKASFPSLSGTTLKDTSLAERLEVVKGDVTDPASLRQALAGCEGVVFAASGKGYWSANSVDCEGVGNVAAVAKETPGCKRVVLVSSCLVTPARRFHPVRILLNNIRWGLMDAKYKGEELLRKSGVPYTIVRPGGLTDGPAGQAQLVTGQGDALSGRVSRADVAAVCVAALTDSAALNVTLELVGKEPAGTPLADQLKQLFQGLKPDT